MAVRQLVVDILARDKGFKQTVTGVGDEADKQAGRMRGSFSGVAGVLRTTMGPAIGETMDQLDNLGPAIDAIKDRGKGMSSIGMGVGTGMAGLGAVLTTVGSGSKAADQQVSQAFKNIGKSSDDYGDKIDSLVGHMAKFGYEDDEVKGALANMVTVTKDPTKAIELMSEAADLAATKQTSLKDASSLIAKAYSGGSTRVLTDYGIKLEGTGTQSEKAQRGLQKLAGMLKGQAAASTDTFSGKLKGIKAQLGNFAGDAGAKWGPSLMVFGTVVTGLSAATDLLSASWVAAAAPIVLVIAAVIAVGAAIYLAYTRVGWFHKAVDAVGRFFRDTLWPILKGIAGWITGTLVPTIWHIAQRFIDIAVSIGQKVGEIVGFVIGIPGRIAATVAGLWSGLTSGITAARNWVSDRIDEVVGFVTGIGGRIAAAVGGLTDLISAPFRAAFNFIADAWNNTVGSLSFHVPGWVPGIGGKGFSVPNLPHFASGVTGFGGGLAVVGERGPEVVNLPRGSDVMSNGRSAGLFGGTTVIVPVTVEGSVVTERDLGAYIRRILLDLQRRSAVPILPGVA
jgi:phage-related protein